MAFAPVFGHALPATFDRHAKSGNGLLNALIAYWQMDEASGNALDAHSNGLTLVSVNSVGSAAGKVYGSARQFARTSNQRLRRSGDDALLSVGDSDFSIAVWIKWSELGGTANHIAGKDNEISQREYRLDWNAAANRIRMRVFDGLNQVGIATANTLGAPSAGVWYFIFGYHDSAANEIGIQINNSTPNTGATTGAPGDTTEMFSVGECGSVDNSPTSGTIGPVAFWKSTAGGGGVLTAAQRTALYNSGAGLAYAAFTT